MNTTEARFRAKLEPVPHGGLFVVVPPKAAAAAHIAYGARVRGTVNGVAYRSSLMKYSGVFHMGVHKAVAQAAGVAKGARVNVTIALDTELLPTDVVPGDLRRDLDRHHDASGNWEKLSPAMRREYVKSIIEAKRAETRARRIASIIETLQEGVPPRRMWEPKGARR